MNCTCVHIEILECFLFKCLKEQMISFTPISRRAPFLNQQHERKQVIILYFLQKILLDMDINKWYAENWEPSVGHVESRWGLSKGFIRVILVLNFEEAACSALLDGTWMIAGQCLCPVLEE